MLLMEFVRQKVKVNVKKSKVVVFDRKKHDVVEFGNPYSVRTDCRKKCTVKLNG